MKNSISFKFNLLAGLLVTVLLVAFAVYNHFQTEEALEESLNSQTEAVLERLALNLPPSMWNFETDQMESIIESEIGSPEISGIFVYDTEKLVLGRVVDEDEEVVEAESFAPDARTKESGLLFDDSGTKTNVGRVVVVIDESAVTAVLNAAMMRSVIQVVVMLVILISAITLLLRQIVIRPLDQVRDALKDISSGEGDLTRRLDFDQDNEIGDVAEHFNSFVDKIQQLVKQVVDSNVQMTELIEELTRVAQSTNHGVQTQNSETDQVAAAVNQMSATANDISQNAADAAAAAKHTNEEAGSAKSVVVHTSTSIANLAQAIDSSAQVINELENDVGNITAMVSVIQSIAEQTNLLALNAAIEAARAGDQGRGFAVVADEVRSLASKSQETTVEIQEIINRLQTGARSAVTVISESKQNGEDTVEEVNKADHSLGDIVKAIETINDMSIQIASASEEQTSVTEEISKSITRIADISNETAHGASSTEAACGQLEALAQQTRQQLGRFKV